MDNLTAEQAADLGDILYQVGQSLEDFRDNNIIPDVLAPGLDQDITQISQASQYMYTLSTSLVMNDAANSLAEIRNITEQINASVKNLKDIKKGISIATAVVTLASSITSFNVTNIANAIGGLINTWKS